LAGSNHVVKYVKSKDHEKRLLQAGFKFRLSEGKRNWLTKTRA